VREFHTFWLNSFREKKMNNLRIYILLVPFLSVYIHMFRRLYVLYAAV
jgi:hypothetical protein